MNSETDIATGWDEWHARYRAVWQSSLHWGAALAVLLALPFARPDLVDILRRAALLFPALGYLVTALGTCCIGRARLRLLRAFMTMEDAVAGIREHAPRSRRGFDGRSLVLGFFLIGAATSTITLCLILPHLARLPLDRAPTVFPPRAEAAPGQAAWVDPLPCGANPWRCYKPDFSDRPWNSLFKGQYDETRTFANTVATVREASVKGRCDVLIVTSNEVETSEVLRLLDPLPGETLPVHVTEEPRSYYVGTYGVHTAVVAECQQGSLGPRSSHVVTENGIDDWSPRAILCVGVAFADNWKKRGPGDVLICTSLLPYEYQKVTAAGADWRGAPLPVGYNLWETLFYGTRGWSFRGVQTESVRVHYGAILSGEKLVNSAEFKRTLWSFFDLAIGGEMEGNGVAAAAIDSGTEWILVKGVMDWGNGDKNDAFKSLAAASAAHLVHFVLSNPTALDTLP